MNKRPDTSGSIDMDRLSRIFTWLTAVVFILMLGVVFGQLIFADTSSADSVSFTQTGVPYTLSYPAGWNAAFDRQHDLVSQSASALASASDTLLVLNDSAITQVNGVGDGYLVELGKVRADARTPYLALLADPRATTVTVSGATKAVKKSGVTTNTGTQTELAISVGSDLYGMTLVTTRDSTNFASDVNAILASLNFSK